MSIPDWKGIVRERIVPLHMQGAAESDLAEELAQHLEGRYRELLSGGASEAEAYQKAVSKLSDVHPLRAMESGSITPRRIYSPCAWA